MRWVMRLIRSWLGRTRYHDQANEVQVRRLRAERMRNYWAEVNAADDHFDRRRRPHRSHHPERRHNHG